MVLPSFGGLGTKHANQIQQGTVWKTEDFSEGFSLKGMVLTRKLSIKLCNVHMYQKFPFSVEHVYWISHCSRLHLFRNIHIFFKCLTGKQGMGCISQCIFNRLGIPALLLLVTIFLFRIYSKYRDLKKDIKNFPCFYPKG